MPNSFPIGVNKIDIFLINLINWGRTRVIMVISLNSGESPVVSMSRYASTQVYIYLVLYLSNSLNGGISNQ